jgi:hypothetical protein
MPPDVAQRGMQSCRQLIMHLQLATDKSRIRLL